MDFVDTERGPKRIALSALRQPGLIAPGEFQIVPDDRRVFRRGFEEKPARVGLQADFAVEIAYLEFVVSAFAHSGDKNLPHTRRSKSAQLVIVAVPAIKIA